MKKKLAVLLSFLFMVVIMPITAYADTNPMATNNGRFVVSKDLIRLCIVALVLVIGYFFSYQIQSKLAQVLKWIGTKAGTYSTNREYYLQRYTYQHDKSLVTKLYRWINDQIVALGLKRNGVTVVGYFMFWAFVAVVLGTAIGLILRMGAVLTVVFWLLCLIIELIMTRVMVSEKMERREADVMNAIDLIVPEVGNGIKNAIVMYKDNFAPSLREDFQAFVTNIQDRGYTFEDAMYILTDNLGMVFKDFAQKAIYYEAVGEKEMQEIFTDITETNRLRRQLRDENNNAFVSLKASFIVSALMTLGYFVFLMFTDSFSRQFFLTNTVGKVLLVIIIMVVFLVLAYITTIKSRAI